MIHYLRHSEINRQKWDELIDDKGIIYPQCWYLDVVHPGWEALVLDDYEAVMPLTGGKKFGVNYLYQPFFVQQLGIISRWPLSPREQREFLRAIPKKFRFAEIRLNETNAFDDDIKGIEYHRNVVMNTNRDYEMIRANYHTNTKRNLAKAESNGLEVVCETELPEIIDLFRANRGATVKVWGDAEYDTLLRLNEAANRGHHSFIVGVKHQETNELLCGGLFLINSDRVTFLFSGCSERGKQLHAMTLMMDDVIKDCAGHPTTFDFEGSDDDNLARFYLGFGGEERRYPSYSYNNMSAAGKAVLRLWKKIK
jgi:hypothetical protein